MLTMSKKIKYWRQYCSRFVARKSLLMVGGAICLSVSQIFSFSTNSAVAQITPDNTLPVNSSVKLEGNTFSITGGTELGTKLGTNLFHSFTEFSVPNGTTAFFDNPAKIQNIISRVTGNSVSNINGLIKASGTANLFFINPSGIVFGSNASLNIGGSFLASTANSIKFTGNEEFSAVAPQTRPLLTTTVPIGLQYGQNPESVINESVNLLVQPGNTLALLPTRSQIVPDNTLPNSSIVSSDFNNSLIEGGTQVGSNLFHSFESFSLPALNTAYFNNTFDIKNIIARVTGSSPFYINGFLQTNGTANLFLINHKGIIFGNYASLSIGGSFVATTANAIQFGNQGFFSASVPNNPVALTVDPSAFVFNQIATAPIQNNSAAPAVGFSTYSTGLRVPDGQSLLLIGGNINMDGGGLNAFGGRVELGGLAKAGTVGLNTDKNLSLNFPDNVERASVSLTNKALIVAAERGGNIGMYARDINISDQSQILAGINEDLGRTVTFDFEAGTITFENRNPGHVLIQASNSVSIRGARTGIFSYVSSSSQTVPYFIDPPLGNSEDITVIAKSLSLADGAQLGSITYGQGNAGNVRILASEFVSLADPRTAIFNSSGSRYVKNAVGNSGKIEISAGSLDLTNGAQIIASTFANGDAGNVSVNVNDSVSLVGGPMTVPTPTDPDFTREDPRTAILSGVQIHGSFSAASTGIFSTVEPETVGNAGNIEIDARSLTLEEGAVIQSVTRGKGNAGNIRVNALEFANFSGFSSTGGFPSGLISSTEEANGQGGDITLTTNALRLSDAAVLSARTRSASRGGNINVDTNTLELVGGGQLVTSAFNSGNAGNITVNANDKVTIFGSDPTYASRLSQFTSKIVDNEASNSGLFARVQGNQRANAGKLKVITGDLSLTQGTITTETTLGEGGDITLNIGDILKLRNNSKITATAGTAEQGGNGGNIDINAPSGFIVAAENENNDIIANAFTGAGGNVTINAYGIFGIELREQQTSKSDITASSKFGTNGIVQINTANINTKSGLINLPTASVNTKIASGCQVITSQDQSSFVVTGRGGLPLNPREAFNNNDTVKVDWVTLSQNSDNRDVLLGATHPTNATPAEATGWVINGFGEVLLTAIPPNSTPHSSWRIPPTCKAPSDTAEN